MSTGLMQKQNRVSLRSGRYPYLGKAVLQHQFQNQDARCAPERPSLVTIVNTTAMRVLPDARMNLAGVVRILQAAVPLITALLTRGRFRRPQYRVNPRKINIQSNTVWQVRGMFGRCPRDISALVGTGDSHVVAIPSTSPISRRMYTGSSGWASPRAVIATRCGWVWRSSAGAAHL